jgi:hypothetical protein
MVLTWARRPRNVERQMVTAKDATRDLVAIVPLRDFTCVTCGDTGWLLVMEMPARTV